MTLWYALCDALGAEFLSMNFMKNALLAVIVMAPLFGLLSTMIVTGKMSFFSDALGHSGFTGIAIGVLCGAALPIWWAVGLAVAFALLFSFVRSRSSQSADTIIGVFSSTAVALGIFIATMGGGSFTKFNKYLIGDILSVTPGEIGALALVLLAVAALWVLCSNQLILTAAGLLARREDRAERDAFHGRHCRRRHARDELGGPHGHQLAARPPGGLGAQRREKCQAVSPVFRARRARRLGRGIDPRLLPWLLSGRDDRAAARALLRRDVCPSPYPRLIKRYLRPPLLKGAFSAAARIGQTEPFAPTTKFQNTANPRPAMQSGGSYFFQSSFNSIVALS